MEIRTRRLRTSVVALALLVAVLPFLGACRVGRPFRGPGYDRARGVVHPAAGERVLVVVTQGDIERGQSGVFAAQLEKVLAELDGTEGLIGYSVRKELVGSRVWTMSVWVDRGSMARFVQSSAHREAMSRGGIPRAAFVSASVEAESQRIPFTWTEADRLLDSQGAGMSGRRE